MAVAVKAVAEIVAVELVEAVMAVEMAVELVEAVMAVEMAVEAPVVEVMVVAMEVVEEMAAEARVSLTVEKAAAEKVGAHSSIEVHQLRNKLRRVDALS